MVLRRDASAVLGLLSILAAPVQAFPTSNPPTCPRGQATQTSTSLNNMLRDMADYNNPNWDPSFRSERSGASSSNWRKNQGYNLSKPTPPELGGSFSSIRDAETNPYYDPGWAQSVRRDNPSQNFQSISSYNGYNDPRNPEMYGGSRSYQYPSTYPGMTSPRRTDKMYTNPTNPYYDPLWTQSYVRRDEPIREGDHTMHYAPGYDRNYYGGMGQGGQVGQGGYYDEGYYGGGGQGMMGGPGRQGPGRGMYATPPSTNRGGTKGGALNGNSFMRKKSTIFQSLDAPRSKMTLLRMSYFDGPEWDGPPYDGPMGMPPPGYGRGPRPGMDYAGVTTGTGGPYGANQMNPNYYRRGGGTGFRRGGVGSRPGGMATNSMGQGPNGRGMGPGSMGATSMGRGPNGMGGGMGGPMGGMGGGMGGPMGGMGGGMGGPMGAGVDPFVRGPGNSAPFPGPFGRDQAVGRTSLKDMAARTTNGPSAQSFNAEVINNMNSRENARAGAASLPGNSEAGGERRGTTTSTTSTSSQYVPLSSSYGSRNGGPVMDQGSQGPLSAQYGPRSPGAVMDRSPPLNAGPPPPPPPPQTFIDTNAMSMELPYTIQAARSVRPSVVLVTSKGVRKENSQGSGFVVAFDDSSDDIDDDDDMMKDKVHILTSAHVAPPGWKVSVTFPNDPDKQYPATVVGRKLNSDLALLCVETVADDDDDDDYPFPPPLVLTGEDVLTDTLFRGNDQVPTSEIGSPVYAFGYPMGVEGPTMTSGILSATTNGINYMDAPTGEEPSEISKSRPFEKTSFVITDASMAGGMSGGPLVNNEGVVLGINALVRPDLRALGNYAVSALECETFLERLEDKRSREASRSGTTKRVSARTVVNESDNSNSPESPRRRGGTPPAEPQESTAADEDTGVAGYRVMLYGYSTDKSDATKVLRRVAGLDELRAENAMRSAHSFGAGVVDEFYVAESGNRGRAVKAARKSADDLLEKLKTEGMMVEVEPLNLLK